MANEKTVEELRYLQSLPLNIKILQTIMRVSEAIDRYGREGLYISFSGGKDSTVMTDIIQKEFGDDIPLVFVNTGLEFPEVQSFVKNKNATIIQPKLTFREVVTKYGYPFISKDVATQIYEVRKYGTDTRAYRKYFTEEGAQQFGSRFSYLKWKPLLSVDFMIGSYCCRVNKKTPAKSYEKKEGRVPIIATTAEESALRRTAWLKEGCNAFDAVRPHCNPISFWTEQDILQYIKLNDLDICSVYGDIVVTDGDGNEYPEPIFPDCKLKTTKYDRTGCIFCAFGAHSEKGVGRLKSSRYLTLSNTTTVWAAGHTPKMDCGSLQRKG